MASDLPDIPMVDLRDDLAAQANEYRSAFERVIESARFILGPEVQAFEQACAEYLGVPHAIGVNSGTDALVIALRALGVGPGDEVITTPFTYIATSEAACVVGASVRFVDIELDTLNLNPAEVAAAISEKTKAIIPVHLFGLPVDLAPLLELADKRGVPVLEDVAQAMGAVYRFKKTGTEGQIAAFSFFPSKNLGGFGDGGLIATSDHALADDCRMLRIHGSRERYHHEAHGYNSRLDALQAALLRVKLPHLDDANDKRRHVAARYNHAFSNHARLRTPIEPEGCHHVYHQYTVRIDGGRPATIQDDLKKHGVSSMIYYPIPLHRQQVYVDSNSASYAASLPNAERAAEEVLSLPIWPGMPEATQQRVIDAVLHELG